MIAGKATVQDITGSKVVKLGKAAAEPGAAGRGPVRRARAREDGQDLRGAGRVRRRARTRTTRTRTPTRTPPARRRFNGPLHNKIPAPDRSKDNSTVWQPDYSRDHYQQLYFGTAASRCGRTTSGSRPVATASTARSPTGSRSATTRRATGAAAGTRAPTPCARTRWNLIRDAIDQWVADQHAAGRTDAQIKADLASYDQWDRNDFDHDGNFNEPDGYIDHFQIVHAGGDEADGDPNQGEDAIWSHRWKAFQDNRQGPEGNKDGGTQIGTTGLWVADYTIQPENGGLSVFAHEYGHDLGLPDHYDTAGRPTTPSTGGR